MTSKSILLFSPPVHKNTEPISPEYMLQSSAFNYPPLGLLYLASNLPIDIRCEIIDSPVLNYSISDCLERIENIRPSVIGITVFTDSLYACLELSKKIKEFDKNIKIVFGGPHINIYPGETAKFEYVDYILTGFAENSFAKLVQVLFKKIVPGETELENIPGLWWKDNNAKVLRSKLSSDPSWDIDKLKRPDRALIDVDRYFTVANQKTITTMVTSRGCPFSCTFCDVFEKKFLQRDVEDIVAEVKEVLQLGVAQIHFFDDCFNLKRERVVDLCNAFINQKLEFEWSFRGRLEPCDRELADLLYEAGCRRVQLGIEATDQETINLIKKKIDITRISEVLKIYREFNIETMGYFIIGFPHQTGKDCVASCEAILKMGFDYINMFILIPYPDTQIYEQLLKRKFIEKDYWLEHALDPKPNFKLPKWHPSLERKELDQLILEYYKKFYLSPQRLFSEIVKTRSVENLFKKIKLAIKMFAH